MPIIGDFATGMRIQRQHGCLHKRQFHKEGVARNEALRLTKKLGEFIAEYYCKFCGGWHVGHFTRIAK